MWCEWIILPLNLWYDTSLFVWWRLPSKNIQYLNSSTVEETYKNTSDAVDFVPDEGQASFVVIHNRTLALAICKIISVWWKSRPLLKHRRYCNLALNHRYGLNGRENKRYDRVYIWYSIYTWGSFGCVQRTMSLSIKSSRWPGDPFKSQHG